jgi:hypothetical protein
VPGRAVRFKPGKELHLLEEGSTDEGGTSSAASE